VKKYISIIALFVIACGSQNSGIPVFTSVHAADLNGYTALYECKSGGANCNVDIAPLTAAACDQTITTSTSPTNDWSAITWTNTVICIEAGNHSARGILTLASSGTAGTRKILRCVTTGGAVCTDPVNTTDANRARIIGLETDTRDYWIVDKLTMNASNGTQRIYVNAGSTFDIFNNILIENFTVPSGTSQAVLITDLIGGFPSDIWFQNSVIRNCGTAAGSSSIALQFAGNRIYIVNNEIYDCSINYYTHQTSNNHEDIVVENNDGYFTTAFYTNCSGTPDTSGNCSKGESAGWSTKANGAAGKPYRVIHNRFWGGRTSDTTVCCDGGGATGGLISVGGGANTADYILVQNNISFDGEGNGLEFNNADGSDNVSVIGNIFYKHRDFRSVGGYAGTGWFFYCNAGTCNTTELYLNTFIDIRSDNGWLGLGEDANADIRCNTVIDSDTHGGTAGTGTQIDYNAFFATTELTTESPDNDLGNYTLKTRANSTAYSLGDKMRLNVDPSSCTSATDTDCVLYVAVQAGTSAGSVPTFNYRGNSVTTDGTVKWIAYRTVYSFYTNLLTTPVQRFIPYARLAKATQTLNATLTETPKTIELGYCPATCGNRTGIGIDDELCSTFTPGL